MEQLRWYLLSDPVVLLRTMSRALTNSEVRLLNRLLERDFPGRDEIAKQVNSARVEQIDINGSFKFFVSRPMRVVTKFRIPVEGDFEDIDGMTIHVLLHVVNGIVMSWKFIRTTVPLCGACLTQSNYGYSALKVSVPRPGCFTTWTSVRMHLFSRT